jgi:hypothetical protein
MHETEESQLLEAVAREQLMKTMQAGKMLRGCCGYLYRLEISNSTVLVVLSDVYEWSMNPLTNPYPVCSHTLNHDNTDTLHSAQRVYL